MTSHRLRIATLAAVGLATAALAPGGPAQPTGRYLLAFHAFDATSPDGRDPRTHRTFIAQSDDGITWSLLPGYGAGLGSVPDLIRRGDTLYVYSAGLRRYHFDTDTWDDSVRYTVRRPYGTHEMVTDPSPTLDEEGRIVLFYLVGQVGSDPAGCSPGVETCTKSFRSATEVADSDGALFTVDPGDRAQVQIAVRGNSLPRSASDPDIFRDATQFVLYVSCGQNVLAFASPTLRGTFEPIAGLPAGMLVRGAGGVASGHFDTETGQYWTYVHRPEGRGGAAVIRRAAHRSLSTPIPESAFSTVLTGTAIEGLGRAHSVESPGFAINTP